MRASIAYRICTGRALNSSGTYNYQYNLTDNLGNARLSFNNTGAAIQQDDYLPFGYDITIGTPAIPKNNYLYNGKELQTDLSLYDYGARLYDPVIARWTSVDPLAEKDRRWSPYHYVEDNPIKLTDPDGMACDPCDVSDEHDFLSYSNEGDKVRNPTKAAIHDASVGILDFLGVKGLIRAVKHLGDENVSTGEKAVNLVQAAVNVVPIDGEGTGERTEIKILPENKIDRDLLNPPKENGNAPTFKKDGKPVDIHHEGQKAEGPFHERHPDNHRTNGSYKENHPPGQKPLTKEERQQFNKAKKEYWKKEYPK